MQHFGDIAITKLKDIFTYEILSQLSLLLFLISYFYIVDVNLYKQYINDEFYVLNFIGKYINLKN